MQKIVIVEPGSSAIHIANAVRHLGYEPIILCSIKEYSGDLKKHLEKTGYYEVSANSADAIIQCIRENKIEDIFGILSTADRFISQSCAAAIALGVRGMDPALLKLNNKAEVVRFIKDDSPPTIIFNKDAIPYDALNEMLKNASAVIFKPSMSAGAKGLFEIKTPEDIDNVSEFMKEEKEIQVLHQDWIAQPAIHGTLYSLEGFVTNGHVHHIGLSRRAKIKYTESQNVFPADDEVAPEIQSALQKALQNLIRASGYKNGYFHTEIIHDGKKAFLIDANFGRVGGAGIALQIAQATGKAIEEIYAHVIEVTFFGDKATHADYYPKEKRKTLSIQYSVNTGSTLIDLHLPHNMKSHHIRIADSGKRLSPAGYNNRSWVGMLTGAPEDVVKEVAEISILTDFGMLKPVF